jgi:ankyrin repeat protein
MEEQSKKPLIAAIISHNVETVKYLLESGEDPNQVFPAIAGADHTIHQPATPLTLVVSCISNPLLEESALEQFAAIAKLFIEYGADPKPAMELAEMRHGKYNPEAEGPLMEVWRVVANKK